MAARRPLGLNVAANAFTAASAITTALLSVPLILGDVGLAGYGVWTLAQTLILWATTAEAGFGPAIQRFVAVGHGGGAVGEVRRLLWSTCAAYALAGLAIALAGFLLAEAFVDLFDVTGRLRDDSVTMFRIAAGAIWLALLAAGLGNVQQGLERFGALAVTTAAGSLAFLAAVVALLAAGAGLRGLAVAAAVQQAVMLTGRAVDLWPWLRGRPALASRGQAWELGAFSLKLQVTTVSAIVNTQTDKVVVGLVASTTTLGQLGIGTQVAEAGRLVSGAALSPIVSRLALVHGAGDAEGFERLFTDLHRLWTVLVIGGTVIGAAVLHPLVEGWLGAGYGEAAVFGGALVAAFGVSLLTGTPVAYLRALGRPGLEARYGLLVIGLNVVLTVALGVAFGAYGVVFATAAAQLLGAAWFFRGFRRATGPGTGRVPRRLLARAVAAVLPAAAAALGWGLLAVALLPTGVALAAVGLGAGAAGAGYLLLATGTRPTPAGVRRLVVSGIHA